MDPLTELRELVDRHTRRAERHRALPQLRLARLIAMTAPAERNIEDVETVVGVIVQGEKRSVLGTRTLDCRAGHVLINSVRAPITGQILRASAREPFLAVGIKLQPARIASLLLDAPRPRSTATPAAMSTSPASEPLLDAFRRYVRLLDAPEDIPVLAAALEREILWRVLQGPHGEALRDIASATSNLALISHAVELLRKRFTEPLRIAELARAAHMSEPTFNRHFRRVTAMSPLQFQKLLRLQEARAMLMAQASDVSSVGLAVGYLSSSQFNREYRRQFGAPPGEDAARLRDGRRGATARPQGAVTGARTRTA